MAMSESLRFHFVFAIPCILALAGLTGCPSSNPDPDPDPDPETTSAFFRVPRTFSAGDGPLAVLAANLNTDAFPDIVTVNALDNTIDYWLSTAAGAYTRATPLPTGGEEPQAIVAKDVDGDELIDLVVANTGSDNLSILFGLGSATFTAASTIALPEGAAPRDVAILDVNGDGAMDLLSANTGLGSVTLLLALPDGSFDDPVNLIAGEGTRALLAADLNKDGLTDLVAANRDSNTLSVFLNVNGALFADATSLPTGTAPRMIRAEDLDNDGELDLVVSNPTSSSFGVHMGAGSGAFDAVVFTELDEYPTRFVLADYTGDGNTDIVSVLFATPTDTVSSGEILVLAGNGRGQFEAATRYYLGAGIVDLAAVDIDRDGRPDLAACNLQADSMLLVESPARGKLDAERRFATGTLPRFVFAGDLNRDSDFDLVVGNLDSNDVTVLLGDGEGGFEPGENVNVGGAARALALGPIDGDNNLDMVVSNLAQSRVAVLFGDGNGGFDAPVYHSVRTDATRSAEPRSIALADMNEDGSLDIVTGNANRDTVAILLNDGDGDFAEAVEYDVGNYPLDVHVADIDEDGNLDVILVNGLDPLGTGSQTFALRVIPGKGDGTLNLDGMVGYVTSANPGTLVVVDADSDGDLDVVTSHRTLNFVQLFLNRGNGSLGSGGTVSVGNGPNTVDAADLNGDGYVDLYTTNDDGTVTLRLRRRSFLYERAESLAVGSLPIAALAIDLDGDSILDLAVPNRDTNNLSVVLGTSE